MNNAQIKALKISIIAFIIAVIIIVIGGRYIVSEQKSFGLFFKKLILDDLANEFLGSLISALIFYLILFALGKSINQLIENDDENEMQSIKNEILDLKNKFITTINILSEKIESLNHEIKIIQPKDIENILEKSRQDTDFWRFSGGTGTYTKVATLPKLSLKSKQLGKSISIELLILNPLNRDVCNLYAELRHSLRISDKDNSEWTCDYVINQSYATIIICYVLSSQNKLLDITIGLKDHFSLFRLDISSTKVLVTQEDPKDLALLINKESFNYESYKTDFQQILKQSKIVTFKNHKKSFSIDELNRLKIKEILSLLGLENGISNVNLDKILEITKNYKSPYVSSSN